MKLLDTFFLAVVGARPQVVVQRDDFGINKQIQLDDGREISVQRPYNGVSQVQVSGQNVAGQNVARQNVVGQSVVGQNVVRQNVVGQNSVGQSQVYGVGHNDNDFEIITRSLMRRVDQLENKLQVEQEIFQNILSSYITGTEWFLENLRPLRQNTYNQLTQAASLTQTQLKPQTQNQIDPSMMQSMLQSVVQTISQSQQVQQVPQTEALSQIQTQQPQPLKSFVTTKLHDVKSTSPNKGILMVYYGGQWGTVCDDDFGSREANTACRSMGYAGARRHTSARRESQYQAPSNAPILLDEVECNDDDSSLFECEAQWNNHNCNHGEDVILECYLSPGTVIRN